MKKILLSIVSLSLFLPLLAGGCSTFDNAHIESYDLVVYGGTSAGVAAAVQASRSGKTAVIIEPGRHLGGLSSGGLGATDIGNKEAIGGISREFYSSLFKYYQNNDVWPQQRRADYSNSRKWQLEKTWWMFEPHVAEAIFNQMVAEAQVPVFFDERLDRIAGVQKRDGRIVSITTENGRKFFGRCFIDATYEGDLMAAAGVSYTIGRESNERYAETLNGVQTTRAIYHQFEKKVDPYIEPGNPASGLLPGLHDGGPGEEGSGDDRVQTYNFRMCLTDAADNRVAFPKPADYDPMRYELLLRYFEAGYDSLPFTLHGMPNRKTDSNNRDAFSTDYIGANYDYPEADYQRRRQIIIEHESYQKGLMWTLANHPRVPEKIRTQVSRWGLAADEFVDNGNWPHQLYVREARRMVSDYVMTEDNCRGKVLAEDSVGLAAYTMDSHHTQRYVRKSADGDYAWNEGDVQVHGFPPYPISYRSIVPARGEASNLLVPVCLSASHIAYGSIRMEPVFMILAQSAATAGCIAIDEGQAVQDVDYEALRKKLLEDKQRLFWN